MEFFTSDLHLGHENILAICPMFGTIEEMNDTLIANWNKKVHKNDTVYILGDFSHRSKVPVESYLRRLNGRKILILGNHDPDWLTQSQYERLSRYFVSIESMLTIKKNKTQITLCHYPMLEWPGSRYASKCVSYLIHGHIHNLRNEIFEYIKGHQLTALNCGVEVNNFEPVTFEELIANNAVWYNRTSAE